MRVFDLFKSEHIPNLGDLRVIKLVQIFTFIYISMIACEAEKPNYNREEFDKRVSGDSTSGGSDGAADTGGEGGGGGGEEFSIATFEADMKPLLTSSNCQNCHVSTFEPFFAVDDNQEAFDAFEPYTGGLSEFILGPPLHNCGDQGSCDQLATNISDILGE